MRTFLRAAGGGLLSSTGHFAAFVGVTDEALVVSWISLRVKPRKRRTQRDADSILKKQSAGTADKRAVLTQMRDLAGDLKNLLTGSRDLDEFAAILHQAWELKRSLGFGISQQRIDEWYTAARKAGAQGGKLLGAGGGGFLLVMAPPEKHEAIREAVGRPRELEFRSSRLGSRIAFVSERH